MIRVEGCRRDSRISKREFNGKLFFQANAKYVTFFLAESLHYLSPLLEHPEHSIYVVHSREESRSGKTADVCVDSFTLFAAVQPDEMELGEQEEGEREV